MIRKALRQALLAAVALWAGLASAFCVTHTVKKGENLTEIARAYGVSVSSLKSANNLANADKIRIGQKLSIPGGKTIIQYTVKPGDSLSSIAAQHGVSTKRLASMNGIRNQNRIRIGQTLKIPIEGDSPGRLSPADRKALARVKVNRSKWRHIILHHTATSNGSAEIFDKAHRRRGMENGLAYHFLIGNGRGMGDGELHIGNRWKRQIQGGHMSSARLNEVAVGICLVGNFQKNRPTDRQMDTLEALLAYLLNATSVPSRRVTTHTLAHKNHTLCPGKYFPFEQVKRNLP